MGQRPLYLLNQIRDFHAHTWDNPFSRRYMWGAVAALGPQAARDLADYFVIPPRPANDGDRELATSGRVIYMAGIPEANIASCYACHGPNGEGIRDIPRLGGLAYSYLKARLEQWGQGYHSGEGRQLGPAEIEALACYLSFVKYAVDVIARFKALVASSPRARYQIARRPGLDQLVIFNS